MAPWDEEIPGVSTRPGSPLGWRGTPYALPPPPGPGETGDIPEAPAVGATAPTFGMPETRQPAAPPTPPGFGERYRTHMAAEPKRADYQLSPRRKFFAGLLSGAAGTFNPRVNAGELYSNVLASPYNRARQQWEEEGQGIEKEANLEKEQQQVSQYDLVPMKVPWSDEPIMVQKKDADALQRELGKETSAAGIATGKEKSQEAQTAQKTQTAYDIAKLKGQNARHNVRVMGDRTMEELEPGKWTDVGPAPPHAEPGNYTAMYDGDYNFLGWTNPKSGRFVGANAFEAGAGLPAGASPQKMPTAAADREAQAKAIGRAAEPLITDIGRLKSKIGNMNDYWKQITLGTPIADKDLSGLAAEIMSFAALQPAAHGARGLQAIKAFEKAIGGIPKDPDALIEAIRKTTGTVGALIRPKAGAAPPAAGGKPTIQFTPSTREGP